MRGKIPYEFRTTVVRELHTVEDMRRLGEWIKGARKLVLQQFVDSERVIQPGLHACTKEERKRSGGFCFHGCRTPSSGDCRGKKG